MSNTNVYDENLNPVLARASNEELGILHDIFIDKVSETLTTEDAYEEHYPNHGKYADLIAKELREFGGNTFANLFRGEGPHYYEIVCDVAKSVKAPFSEGQEIADVEASILATILAKAFEKMSEEEKLVILEEIGKSDKSWVRGGSAMAFQAVLKAGGFASYKLMLIVVNALVKGAIGRGLPLVVNAALTRAMGIAIGPIGWAFSIILTLIEIGAPSYKVTIPSVAYIAMLRAKQQTVLCRKCKAVVGENFTFCPECGTRIEEEQ